MTFNRPRSLSDVLHEDIIPRLEIETAYADVTFRHRQGRYWRGGCPIHHGTDSNFTVDVQTLSWTCFSHCGYGSYTSYLNGGEVPRGQRFVDLVLALADRVGITIERRELSHEEAAAAQRRAALEAFTSLAADTLSQPEGANVVLYLNDRGFAGDGQALARMGLGANPSRAQVVRLGAGAAMLREAGLDDSRWAGRLLIPWRDESGRIATIAARDTRGEEPKYLYLRDATRPPFYRPQRSRERPNTAPLVVVEGLLDAIAMGAAGVTNVVALGGTAISDRHVGWLASAGVANVVLALDADEAGERASHKFGEALAGAPTQFHIHAVPLEAYSGAKDPAEAIARGGTGAAQRLVSARLPWLVWCGSRVVAGLTPDAPTGVRRDALDALTTLAAKATGPDRDADIEDLLTLALRQLGYSDRTVHAAFGLAAGHDLAPVPWNLAPTTVALLLAVCDGLIPGDAHPESEDAVWSVISELPEREVVVLACRYGRSSPPMALADIGVNLGVSGERVRQLLNKALVRLRVPRRKARLLGMPAPPKPMPRPPKPPNASDATDNPLPDTQPVSPPVPPPALSDEIVRILHAADQPLRVAMLTHILRSSHGPITQQMIERYHITGMPSAALQHISWKHDADDVETACNGDPRLEWAGPKEVRLTGSDVPAVWPNAGARWTQEEQADFEAQWQSGLSVNEIAAIHGRSTTAIAYRAVSSGFAPDIDAAMSR